MQTGMGKRHKLRCEVPSVCWWKGSLILRARSWLRGASQCPSVSQRVGEKQKRKIVGHLYLVDGRRSLLSSWLVQIMTVMHKGTWRCDWRGNSGCLPGVFLHRDAVIAASSPSGLCVSLYSPSGKWRGSCDTSLVKVRRSSPERPSTGPSLAFSWLCLFLGLGLQVRKGASICKRRWEESLGLQWLWQIVLEAEDEQMAAKTTSLRWPIGSLFSASSGADPGEQWLRNNSLKVIFLKFFLLWQWDKEQMQKLSSRPGLTRGISSVGCPDQAPGLSYSTGEELLLTRAGTLGCKLSAVELPMLFGE